MKEDEFAWADSFAGRASSGIDPPGAVRSRSRYRGVSRGPRLALSDLGRGTSLLYYLRLLDHLIATEGVRLYRRHLAQRFLPETNPPHFPRILCLLDGNSGSRRRGSSHDPAPGPAVR